MDFACRNRGDDDEDKRLWRTRSKDRRSSERGTQEDFDFNDNVTSPLRRRRISSSCASSPGRPLSPIVVIGSEEANSPSIDEAVHEGPANKKLRVKVPCMGQQGGLKTQQFKAQDPTESSSPIIRSSSHHSLYIRLEPPESDVCAIRLPGAASTDSHIDQLLHTGVYDHPGIPPSRFADSHSGPKGPRLSVFKNGQCHQGLPNYCDANTQTADYQDKGVMVSPWSDSHLGLPPFGSARQTRDKLGNGNSVSGSIRQTVRIRNEVGVEHPKRPESRVDETTDSVPKQCHGIQTLHGVAEAPHQTNDHGLHHASSSKLREEPPWNPKLLAPDGDSRSRECATSRGESASKQTDRELSRACPVWNSPPGFGGYGYLRFPENRPRVQPLRCGVLPPPQEHGRPWTSVGILPVDGELLQLNLQGQPILTTLNDARLSELEKLQSAESADDEVAESETLQEFIARMEDEMLGRDETDSCPGQGSEQPGAGDSFLDKRAVDSQPQDLRADAGESNYQHLEVSRTLGMRYGSAPASGHCAAPRSGSPLVDKTSQSWHNALTVEDLDMVGFWRPNMLI